MAIDLHSHSRYSDGSDTPAEIVATARAKGLTALALTDHDLLDGLATGAVPWTARDPWVNNPPCPPLRCA